MDISDEDKLKSFLLLSSLNNPLTRYLINTILLEIIRSLEQFSTKEVLQFKRYCGSEESVVVIPSNFCFNFLMDLLLYINIYLFNTLCTHKLYNKDAFLKVYKGTIGQVVFVNPCRIIII